MSDVNNETLMNLINGLSFDEQTKEYAYKENKYRLKGSQDDSKTQKNGVVVTTSVLYFVNISNPTDLKTVTCVNDIPTYDGFNNIKIDKKIRNVERCKKYYYDVTVNKRHEATEKATAEREKEKEKKLMAKIIAKAEKFAQTEPKKCEYCGNEFIPKQKAQRFCCDSCRKRYYSRMQSDKIVQANKSEKICPICNKKFIGTPRETYCSKECYKVSQQENRRKRYEREKAQDYYIKGGKYSYNNGKTENNKQSKLIEKSGYGRKIDW